MKLVNISLLLLLAVIAVTEARSLPYRSAGRQVGYLFDLANCAVLESGRLYMLTVVTGHVCSCCLFLLG